MDKFIFNIELGLHHVLDFGAYDHILFLSALALPFHFKQWKKLIFLASIFTIAHCTSLFLSVYEIVVIDVALIEFLIPVTILGTAIFNLLYSNISSKTKSLNLYILATAFFGLIHGFGFSNYFKMLIAEDDEKLSSLLGFATGIEISQVLIVLLVSGVSYVLVTLLKLKASLYLQITSILIILITIPMLINTFPW